MDEIAPLSISTYSDAVNYLYGRINYEKLLAGSYTRTDFRLDRVRQLLMELGAPQERIPVVHIAGTKGKGSTAILTASVLSKAGYRTGLFTSPHIHRFEERFQVDGISPDEDEIIDLVNELIPAVQRVEQLFEGHSPTFFEMTTALGWLYFAKRNCEIVVLEVGMGGRLDATNVCRPVLCTITNISYDHTAILGNTLAEIAGEKAGIIKTGIPVVTAARAPEAFEVIQQTAVTREAPLYSLGSHFQWSFEPADSSRILIEAGPARYSGPCPFVGEHQAENMATVFMMVELLRQQGWRISSTAFEEGIATARLPLRIEVLQSNPVVIADAAHNCASAEALQKTLRQHYPAARRHLIFATSRDKDAAGILQMLSPCFDTIMLTQYQTNPRALPAFELLQSASAICSQTCEVSQTPQEAWEKVRNRAGTDDLICITGSFFLAAELREVILNQKHPGSCNSAVTGTGMGN